jgi:hypothetical protein
MSRSGASATMLSCETGSQRTSIHPLPKHDGRHERRLFPTKLLTRPESAWFPAAMTQRNNHPQAIVATPTGVPLRLQLIAAAALVLVLVLITAITGAGIGFA